MPASASVASAMPASQCSCKRPGGVECGASPSRGSTLGARQGPWTPHRPAGIHSRSWTLIMAVGWAGQSIPISIEGHCQGPELHVQYNLAEPTPHVPILRLPLITSTTPRLSSVNFSFSFSSSFRIIVCFATTTALHCTPPAGPCDRPRLIHPTLTHHTPPRSITPWQSQHLDRVSRHKNRPSPEKIFFIPLLKLSVTTTYKLSPQPVRRQGP